MYDFISIPTHQVVGHKRKEIGTMSSETKASLTTPEPESKMVHYLFSSRWRDCKSCDCNNNGSPCYSCENKITIGPTKCGLFITTNALDPSEVVTILRDHIHEVSEFKYRDEIMIFNLHTRDPGLVDDESSYDLLIKGKKVKYNEYS